jgi:VanZ family protein
MAMLTVLVLSLMPPTLHMPTTGWDKSNHMLGFAALAVLGHAAWPSRTWTVLVGLLAYGGLIEVLQSFTPDRVAEWADLLADGVGLLVGKGCVLLSMRRRRSPE